MGAEFDTFNYTYSFIYGKGKFETRPMKIPLIEISTCALYVSIK